MNVSNIIGHKRQIRNLESLIKKGTIPHTLLFQGPSGIGKKIIAKRFLNALFCQSKDSPCLSCSICAQIDKGIFLDLIEISSNEKGIIPIGSKDGRESGSIRWLIDRLSRKSIYGKIGVLIDGIDKITEEGQNALLKTIEEPSSVIFMILISSSRAKLLPTLMSRCFEMKFYPLSESEIIETLKGKDIPARDSYFISKISDGSVETALMLTKNDNLCEIIKVCSQISSFLRDRTILNIDLAIMRKRFSYDLLINIYRENLLSIINDRYDSNLKEIFIEDAQKVFYLLKILLALKKSEIYHLNIQNAIKGMLYTLYNNSFEDIPLLNFYTGIPGG